MRNLGGKLRVRSCKTFYKQYLKIFALFKDLVNYQNLLCLRKSTVIQEMDFIM